MRGSSTAQVEQPASSGGAASPRAPLEAILRIAAGAFYFVSFSNKLKMSSRPYRDDEDDETPGYRYDDPFDVAPQSVPRRGARRSSTRDDESEDSIDGLYHDDDDSFEEAELASPPAIRRPDSRSSNA